MRTLSRRTLLKLGVVGGTGVLLGPTALSLLEAKAQSGARYELNDPTRCIQTSCLQCNTGCPIKVKIQDGVAAKIDGNPITPHTMYPHLPYDSSLETIAATDGSLCARGQAGIQSAYDPYRIRRVLKRAGPRGSGKWQEISLDQAVREIAQGGQTFAGIGDDRVYPGVADSWAIRDPAVMRAMSTAVNAILAEGDREAKARLVERFKVDFRDHVGAMIDPDHPDLGPKNNEITFAWGRLKAGRREFLNHFFRDTLGTVNMHGHTTVCQGSLYFTAMAMSDQYVYDGGKGRHAWSGGRKSYWQADLMGTEFVIVVGSNILEGGYGMPLRTSKVTQAGTNGRLKIAVVDPRALKLNNYAERWLAPKPGEDAAIALGMMRWMFDNDRYDARFLAAANKAGATAAGETTWTNATWLVKIGADGTPGEHLRASDLGLDALALTIGDREVELDAPIVLVDGVPTPFDPNDGAVAATGDLFVDTTIDGHRVKSGLGLIREEAFAHTIDEWADIAGVAGDDIRWLAFEFTNHGKRAAIDIHRGVSQHTNGFYNVLAWYTMAAMMGVWDWQGGMGWQSNNQITGARAGGPFEIGKLHPRKLGPFGLSVIRHERSYEASTLFDGYPAKRPWYPFASDIYQETIASGAMGYPYRTKVLFHYMGDPAYALPAGQTQIEAMLDPDKIGLIVGFDIVVGNSYAYADYIVPDLSYLERWEFHGSHPNVIWKVQPARQPAIAPIPDEVTVFGEASPISLESFLMRLAQELEAPGYGPGALADGSDFTHPDHLYLKLAANLAFGERADGGDAVPEASDAELDAFLQARRHLPASVYDPARWMQVVGDDSLWRRTVYMLNRGGRFEDFEAAFAAGGKIARRYGQQLNLYLEKLATARNSMTGAPYHPVASYIPPYLDALGRPVGDDDYDLTLITHRIPTMTKGRTISNYWLLNVRPENHIEVAAADATRMGLRDDQEVRVVSASNPNGEWPLGHGKTKPLVAKVKVRQGLRPGTVTFALGYGHWGYGAGDVEIDGHTIPGDTRRQKGIQANAAMRIDPALGDVALSDLVGGSVVFYETKVRLVPA